MGILDKLPPLTQDMVWGLMFTSLIYGTGIALTAGILALALLGN